MDELGSALRHSDNANFRVSPFLFMPEGKLTSAIRYIHKWIYYFAAFVPVETFILDRNMES
jgi:hypothetical protein